MAVLSILNLFLFLTVRTVSKTKHEESNEEMLKDCNIMLASCNYLQILKTGYLLGSYTIPFKIIRASLFLVNVH